MRAISFCFHNILDAEQVKRGDVYTLKLRDFKRALVRDRTAATLNPINSRIL